MMARFGMGGGACDARWRCFCILLFSFRMLGRCGIFALEGFSCCILGGLFEGVALEEARLQRRKWCLES